MTYENLLNSPSRLGIHLCKLRFSKERGDRERWRGGRSQILGCFFRLLLLLAGSHDVCVCVCDLFYLDTLMGLCPENGRVFLHPSVYCVYWLASCDTLVPCAVLFCWPLSPAQISGEVIPGHLPCRPHSLTHTYTHPSTCMAHLALYCTLQQASPCLLASSSVTVPPQPSSHLSLLSLLLLPYIPSFFCPYFTLQPIFFLLFFSSHFLWFTFLSFYIIPRHSSCFSCPPTRPSYYTPCAASPSKPFFFFSLQQLCPAVLTPVSPSSITRQSCNNLLHHTASRLTTSSLHSASSCLCITLQSTCPPA